MNVKIALASCLLLLVAGTFAHAAEPSPDAAAEPEFRNLICVTPTLALFGMYGLQYARALDEHLILTVIGGYTNFDIAILPFLKNDGYVYENVYAGLNLSWFPFSDRIFPRGFYLGLDFVPSLGFYTDRAAGTIGTGLGLSGDVVVGYSWIIAGRLKIAVDAYLNVNAPGIGLSGPSLSSDWSFYPAGDINIGLLF